MSFESPQPVWLRGGVHVSCGQILQAVWLVNKHWLLYIDPMKYYVWNTGKKESSEELIDFTVQHS